MVHILINPRMNNSTNSGRRNITLEYSWKRYYPSQVYSVHFAFTKPTCFQQLLMGQNSRTMITMTCDAWKMLRSYIQKRIERLVPVSPLSGFPVCFQHNGWANRHSILDAVYWRKHHYNLFFRQSTRRKLPILWWTIGGELSISLMQSMRLDN